MAEGPAFVYPQAQLNALANAAIESSTTHEKEAGLLKNQASDKALGALRRKLSVHSVVHHPEHYTRGKIEVWDFIIDQQLTYCLGNAVKYLCRAGYKDVDKQIEDLEKAKAYIDREIERLQS